VRVPPELVVELLATLHLDGGHVVARLGSEHSAVERLQPDSRSTLTMKMMTRSPSSISALEWNIDFPMVVVVQRMYVC
jgi:hypothetical protein